MMAELVAIEYLAATLRARLAATADREAGYSTEAVVVTALMVALAIAAVGIIAAKVIAKAESITP